MVVDFVVDLCAVKEGLGITVVVTEALLMLVCELVAGLEVDVVIEGSDGPANIAVDEGGR